MESERMTSSILLGFKVDRQQQLRTKFLESVMVDGFSSPIADLSVCDHWAELIDCEWILSWAEVCKQELSLEPPRALHSTSHSSPNISRRESTNKKVVVRDAPPTEATLQVKWLQAMSYWHCESPPKVPFKSGTPFALLGRPGFNENYYHAIPWVSIMSI